MTTFPDKLSWQAANDKYLFGESHYAFRSKNLIDALINNPNTAPNFGSPLVISVVTINLAERNGRKNKQTSYKLLNRY